MNEREKLEFSAKEAAQRIRGTGHPDVYMNAPVSIRQVWGDSLGVDDVQELDAEFDSEDSR